jgi:osmoprotectant transport system permease protein
VILRAVLLSLLLLFAGAPAMADDSVRVGSKRFTESYLLGELITQSLQAGGLRAEHRQGLGNTAIVAAALQAGEIDVYAEYSGTLLRELLRHEGPEPDPAGLEALLAPRGLTVLARLGFHNGYALALREAEAERLGLRRLSDLARLPPAALQQLRVGLTHEFLVRADGWSALARAYRFPAALRPGAGVDHGLALQALASGQLDVIDVYTTDAQIARLGLRVLVDDLGFFPRYEALLLARRELPEAARRLLQERLAGQFDEATMIRLNGRAELDGLSFAEVARQHLARSAAAQTAPQAAPQASPARPGFWSRLFAPDLPRLLVQHLLLVGAALALAIAIGLPLALLADARPRLAGALQAAVALLQTVPSLALLAVGVALLGRIGFVPALLALAAYALLPIVANTLAGLRGVPAGLVQAGRALGLRDGQLLRHVRLPLALPIVWTGITSAAVISVGSATVAAFVGAGGLGERIVAGLAVNDPALMLAGALPAAVLAIAVQGVGVAVGRWVERGRGG